jgi:hypothetical protein
VKSVNGVVERQADVDHRAVGSLLFMTYSPVRLGKHAVDVRQITNGAVDGDDVHIILRKPAVEAVGVANRDHQGNDKAGGTLRQPRRQG